MGDLGDFWRDVKEGNDERKRIYDNRTMDIVFRKLGQLEKLGFKLDFKNHSYQVRINGVLDIYTQNKRYHDIKRNIRGDYQDMVKFVVGFFKQQESSKQTATK